MKPGLYRMHFRGLTLRECWRFGPDPLRFTIAVILKTINFKGPNQWLPVHEAEGVCAESDLTEGARGHLLHVVSAVQQLGYRRGEFGCLLHNLDPNTKEGFSYRAIHDDGIRCLFIGYIASTASGTLKHTVIASGVVVRRDESHVEFLNHRNYFDGNKRAVRVKVSGSQPADVDRRMAEYLARHGGDVKTYSSLAVHKQDSIDYETSQWDTRIARGLFRAAVR